jgi:polyphenol oxidase
MSPEFLRPEWPAPPGVRAAFTLRRGGVSAPPFDTLNLGLHTGDGPEAVAENRRRVRRTLQLPAEPVWLQQVHGAQVLRLATAELRGGGQRSPPTADGAVTRERGQVCAIQVADCIPVLLAALDGSAVGAAHAGWRGLASGVLAGAVRALGAVSGEHSGIVAWLGPAIGAAHFEVGEEVHAAFSKSAVARGEAPPPTEAFVRNARGRWQCDLAAIARGQLVSLGVREVYGGTWCTYADAARFFSYRRDGRCGRMAALIWLEA